jgi:hypothetical protein
MSKSSFKNYCELSSSDLKQIIEGYKTLPLEKFKEVLYILKQRENYKIESSSVLANIISHYGLTRSGELVSTDDEVVKYDIVDVSKTSSTNNLKSTNSIANLKMLHAGGLISGAGKNLFISQILLLSTILINFFSYAYGDKQPEILSQNNFANIVIINGVILTLTFVLQLRGYSALYSAGEIFKTKD